MATMRPGKPHIMGNRGVIVAYRTEDERHAALMAATECAKLHRWARGGLMGLRVFNTRRGEVGFTGFLRESALLELGTMRLA